jgi:mannose-1-phosphate guanylyltransferase
MTELAHWPAFVLTAGLATRLRPLSDLRAKGAMPVAGSAIIVRILRWLHAAGVRRVVLNLHHRPETITLAVGDGSHLGLEVRYSWEPVLLGTAGGPRRALPLLAADRFLIVNGDTLTDCDLRAVADHHVDCRARVTMAVVEGDVRRYGGVRLDAEQRVRGFGQPADGLRTLHFIGVQAVEASVFAGLRDDEPSETVRTLYPRLIESDRDAVRAHESDAEFLDVGTARDYLSTVATIAAREQRPFDVGHDCHIADDAIVEHSVLWDRVTVGRGARIIHCVVADDVKIPDGAHYENRVLVAGTDKLSVDEDESPAADRPASLDSTRPVERPDSVYSVDL